MKAALKGMEIRLATGADAGKEKEDGEDTLPGQPDSAPRAEIVIPLKSSAVRRAARQFVRYCSENGIGQTPETHIELSERENALTIEINPG